MLKALKETQATREIPVIFITALGEEEEKGLQLGAVDYIIKPFQPAIVVARIKIHLKIVRQRKVLENIALLDGLTEIPNRRSFKERFAQEWQRAMRYKSPLSLGILDVDYFKQYNDTYGHGQGDEVLKSVAELISMELKRSADFAARYGGEEFILLMPETDVQGAVKLAKKVCKEIENLCIPHSGSLESKWLTVSIGGATMVPSMEQIDRQLFEAADKRLYEAKNKGRNQVIWQHIC